MTRPFFSYYGAKWKSAHKYPNPFHDKIFEPFAGAAGYSVRHSHRQVVLFDIDPNIVDTWKYLISAKKSDIMSLPILQPGQDVNDVDISLPAKKLIGWWLNEGSNRPKRTATRSIRNALGWSERTRSRIAEQLPLIKSWTVHRTSYQDLDDDKMIGTWFIDPPYQEAGKCYTFSSTLIDYTHLAFWCLTRVGQVIVCENYGASWLSFDHRFKATTQSGKHKTAPNNIESFYYNESQRMGTARRR